MFPCQPSQSTPAPLQSVFSAAKSIESERSVRSAYCIVRVFYATDRRATGVPEPESFYSGERSDAEALALGTVEVSIPRDHRIGEIERPSFWRFEFREDPAKHVVLLSVDPKSDAEFFDRLAKKVADSEDQEAFVFIHGYSVTFAEAARRTAQLAYDLS